MTFEPIDTGDHELNRTINMIRAELDDTPPTWWYLSFVDRALDPPPDQQRPGGPSWLGACWVKAPNAPMACSAAWELECNPGGEVSMLGPVSDEDMDAHVPEDQRNRLLSRTDLGIPEL